jgi:hypothetical protein
MNQQEKQPLNAQTPQITSTNTNTNTSATCPSSSTQTTETCSLSIMVARTDLPFMMHTIPHLVRGCNFPFFKRVLVMDTAPLSGDKVNRPGVGTMEDLRAACQTLIDEGIMDEVIEMDYSDSYRREIYKKHFGISEIRLTHNYKGYPILGSIFAIENVPGDYIVHFDSDMLLHQQSGFNWIELGMELLKRRDEVMFVRPFTGFPLSSESQFHQTKSYDYDPEGFYKFTFFSSRAFLLKRTKFEQLLPMPVLWLRFKRQWLRKLPPRVLTSINNWTGRGKLDSWEVIVSNQLKHANCVRATLAHPQAWTLHPTQRSPEFIDRLPDIIDRIERGDAPKEQSGYYDLQLEYWL